MTTKKRKKEGPKDTIYMIVTMAEPGMIGRLEIPEKIIISPAIGGCSVSFSGTSTRVEIDGMFGMIGASVKMATPPYEAFKLIVSKQWAARIVNHLMKVGWTTSAAHVTIQNALEERGKLDKFDFIKDSKELPEMAKEGS